VRERCVLYRVYKFKVWLATKHLARGGLRTSLVAERPSSSPSPIIKPFTFHPSTCLMLAQGTPFTCYTIPFDTCWLVLAEGLHSPKTGFSPLTNHFSLLTLHERALLLRHSACVFGRLRSAFGRT
jgi:hypothetical protein